MAYEATGEGFAMTDDQKKLVDAYQSQRFKVSPEPSFTRLAPVNPSGVESLPDPRVEAQGSIPAPAQLVLGRRPPSTSKYDAHFPEVALIGGERAPWLQRGAMPGYFGTSDRRCGFFGVVQTRWK